MKRKILATGIVLVLLFAISMNSFAGSAEAHDSAYLAELECQTKTCTASTFCYGNLAVYVSLTAYVTLAAYGVTLPANPVIETEANYAEANYNLGWSSNYLAYARSTHGDDVLNDRFSLYADAS